MRLYHPFKKHVAFDPSQHESDFTLANARRFYFLIGGALSVNGLSENQENARLLELPAIWGLTKSVDFRKSFNFLQTYKMLLPYKISATMYNFILWNKTNLFQPTNWLEKCRLYTGVISRQTLSAIIMVIWANNQIKKFSSFVSVDGRHCLSGNILLK